MKTTFVVVALAVGALAPIGGQAVAGSPTAPADGFRMLVNHGVGWSEGGGVETTARRRHEAESAKAKILGTAKEHFNFDDCMTASGQPTD